MASRQMISASTFSKISQALQVVKHPDVLPSALGYSSNHVVLWLCDCGITFKQKMNATTSQNQQVLCPGCRAIGASCLEFEVAALLRAQFPDLTFIQHSGKEEYSKTVDIYVKEIDMAIELDSYTFHHKNEDHDSEMTGKLTKHYTEVLRVRDHALNQIPNSVLINKEFASYKVEQWVDAITLHLVSAFHVNKVDLTHDQKTAVLTTANEQWEKHRTTVKNPASEQPYASEFIRNLTRPGKKLTHVGSGSNDSCEWLCPRCGHIYKNRIQRRTQGIDCPKHKGENIRDGRINKPAKSPVSEQPYAQYFIHNLTHPGRLLENTPQGARDMCVWSCPECGGEHEQGVNQKTRGQGCPLMTGSKISAASRNRRAKNPASDEPYAPEFVRNITKGRSLESTPKTSYVDICEWKCAACSVRYEMAVASRTRGKGCPQCR